MVLIWGHKNIACPFVDTADNQREEMILAQITYLHNEQVSIQNHFLGMLYIPLAFLGVMIYYAYASPASYVLFLLLPFLFSWCIFNLMKYTMKALGLDAYIRYLEGILNRQFGENLFCWQSYLVYTNGYLMWGILGQIPCLVVVYTFLIFKFHQSLEKITSPSLSLFLCIAFWIHAVLLIIMALFTAKHYHKVKRKVENINS